MWKTKKYFDRFVNAIDKIADIDSDVAREAILNQLLSEPRDFIESCRQAIESAHDVKVEAIVTVGHLLKDHLKISRRTRGRPADFAYERRRSACHARFGLSTGCRNEATSAVTHLKFALLYCRTTSSEFLVEGLRKSC